MLNIKVMITKNDSIKTTKLIQKLIHNCSGTEFSLYDVVHLIVEQYHSGVPLDNEEAFEQEFMYKICRETETSQYADGYRNTKYSQSLTASIAKYMSEVVTPAYNTIKADLYNILDKFESDPSSYYNLESWMNDGVAFSDYQFDLAYKMYDTKYSKQFESDFTKIEKIEKKRK